MTKKMVKADAHVSKSLPVLQQKKMRSLIAQGYVVIQKSEEMVKGKKLYTFLMGNRETGLLYTVDFEGDIQ